jgi:pSer/pThr/pTyr-binding forkhead associated (FHA) protein
VSRQHVMVRLTNAGSANWRLSVIDLNSTNGTMVQRWTGGGFDAARLVPADQETHLGTRDRLILGDTVLLRLSGKRYLAEPTSLPPEPARLALPPDATAVTRRPR